MSEKSETVWKRRPALVGFRLRRAMVTRSALEEVDTSTRGQGDDRPLGVRTLPVGGGLTVALALALAVEGVHVEDSDVEDLLHRVADLDLGGLGVDDGRVDVVLQQAVGLLAHHRAEDDVAGVVHDSFPAVVAAAAAGMFDLVKTMQSQHSTA